MKVKCYITIAVLLCVIAILRLHTEDYGHEDFTSSEITISEEVIAEEIISEEFIPEEIK